MRVRLQAHAVAPPLTFRTDFDDLDEIINSIEEDLPPLPTNPVDGGGGEGAGEDTQSTHQDEVDGVPDKAESEDDDGDEEAKAATPSVGAHQRPKERRQPKRSPAEPWRGVEPKIEKAGTTEDKKLWKKLDKIVAKKNIAVEHCTLLHTFFGKGVEVGGLWQFYLGVQCGDSDGVVFKQADILPFKGEDKPLGVIGVAQHKKSGQLKLIVWHITPVRSKARIKMIEMTKINIQDGAKTSIGRLDFKGYKKMTADWHTHLPGLSRKIANASRGGAVKKEEELELDPSPRPKRVRHERHHEEEEEEQDQELEVVEEEKESEDSDDNGPKVKLKMDMGRGSKGRGSKGRGGKHTSKTATPPTPKTQMVIDLKATITSMQQSNSTLSAQMQLLQQQRSDDERKNERELPRFELDGDPDVLATSPSQFGFQGGFSPELGAKSDLQLSLHFDVLPHVFEKYVDS